MSLRITWKEAPVYPSLIKGPAAGIVDGRLLVAGGMSYPWREVEYGFWLRIEETPEPMPSLVVPGETIESPMGRWHPLPPLPIGPGWTSGGAVAGGLAVVGGRRRAVGTRATADVWWLDVQGEATTWERLQDRPTPAMVATTFGQGDILYTAFGSDWQPNEHATGDPNIYRMNVRERSGWEVIAEFPGRARWMGGMAVCGGKLYVLGGRDQPLEGVTEVRPHDAHRPSADRPGGAPDFIAYSELWVCDLETGEWRELEPTPRAFVAPAFTVADRWIVLTGGASWIAHPPGVSVLIRDYVPQLGFMCYSCEAWAYDTLSGEWSYLDRLPYGIASHRVATWRDRVYLVGNETWDPVRSNTFGTVFEGRIEVLLDGPQG